MWNEWGYLLWAFWGVLLSPSSCAAGVTRRLFCWRKQKLSRFNNTVPLFYNNAQVRTGKCVVNVMQWHCVKLTLQQSNALHLHLLFSAFRYPAVVVEAGSSEEGTLLINTNTADYSPVNLTCGGITWRESVSSLQWAGVLLTLPGCETHPDTVGPVGRRRRDFLTSAVGRSAVRFPLPFLYSVEWKQT